MPGPVIARALSSAVSGPGISRSYPRGHGTVTKPQPSFGPPETTS
jgi:hypothetical protein